MCVLDELVLLQELLYCSLFAPELVLQDLDLRLQLHVFLLEAIGALLELEEFLLELLGQLVVEPARLRHTIVILTQVVSLAALLSRVDLSGA